ncbi:MAG: hypothetical protein CL764_06590 [Chloroflexi bacterium]|nr:hypothetical protein [Chloroflexota bacterium]|tara:strand:- start:634 stop:1029 length:396 start_codon:yes stop_codon:yes gene_type:complete
MKKSNNKIYEILSFLSIGIVCGSLTGLIFVIIQKLLTFDSVLSLPEFFILLLSPIIASLLIFKLFNNSLIKNCLISFFTLIIPILGTSFGSGDYSFLNQLGIFSFIGGIGGLFWSVPISLTILFKKKKINN